MEILDHRGMPVRKELLTASVSGATVGGVRSILPTWSTRHISPRLLAQALREAETPGHGASRGYLELAERMEEGYPHYLGVLSTRKRAVCRIPIRVEPADDSAGALRDAELARAILHQPGIRGGLKDVMDAVGKGFSASEIEWELSERQWMPVRLHHRLPQWFDYDLLSGRRLLLRTEEGDGWMELPGYKMVVHQAQAKSGLPIRGGIARVAAWSWMFQSYGLKDWVRFCEAYGLPMRVGKYGPHATKPEQDVLWRAVRNIASDAAAIIPESMMIDFVTDSSLSGRSEIFKDLIHYLDSKVSIAVLGQTLTTQEGQSGSYALGQTHNLVREDIEEEDGAALAETLREQLVIPAITLNHGPRRKYPQVIIRKESVTEIGVLADAVSKLVPAGLRVRQEDVRNRLGLSAPDEGDEVLAPPSFQPPAPQGQDPQGQARQRAGLPSGSGLLPANARQGEAPADPLDLVLDAIDADEWQAVAAPLIEPILLRARSEPEALMDDMADLWPEMSSRSLEQQLAQLLFVSDLWERLQEQRGRPDA